MKRIVIRQWSCRDESLIKMGQKQQKIEVDIRRTQAIIMQDENSSLFLCGRKGILDKIKYIC